MEDTEPQTVTLDVMPLIAGHLPLPAVRLSKYIAASQPTSIKGTYIHNFSITLFRHKSNIALKYQSCRNKICLILMT